MESEALSRYGKVYIENTLYDSFEVDFHENFLYLSISDIYEVKLYAIHKLWNDVKNLLVLRNTKMDDKHIIECAKKA